MIGPPTLPIQNVLDMLQTTSITPPCQIGYQQHSEDCINSKIITMSHFLDIKSQLVKCSKTETSLFKATDV